MQYLDAISKTTEWSLFVSDSITVIQVYTPTSNKVSKGIVTQYSILCCWRSWSWMVLWRHTRPSRTPKKEVLFIIGDWNAKAGSQETPGVMGKFGFEVRNETGQRLIEFCQENALVIAQPSLNNTREDSTHGHHQMANTKIRLIIFFAAKDGEALYSQKSHSLTVAQIMNSLLPNSDWNWRK